METRQLRLFVLSAPDESPLRSPEYQKWLREFAESMKAQGLDFSSHVELREAVGAETIYLGDFAIKLAAIVGPALGAVVGAWLHGRYDRKVRVRIGDVEVEAQTLARSSTSNRRGDRLVEVD